MNVPFQRSYLLVIVGFSAALLAGCTSSDGGGGGGDGQNQNNINENQNSNTNENQNSNANQNGNENGLPPIPDGEYYPTDRPRLDGVEYYVATDGDDADPGTLDAPWATLQHAADVMEPGDITYIRGGVYYESVETTTSGTPTGDIVFAAYSGEEPILDGAGVDANNGFIVAHDYIVLRGLAIRNWGENAVWIENAGYTFLVDCEIYEVTYGIGAYEGTHDFVFDHVIAHDFDLYGFDVSPGDSDCYNGVFWQCVAHTGRDLEQNVDGFALGHGQQHDFQLYRCHTYGVYDGFDISSRDSRLERCSAHHCINAGFKIWQDNVELVNCLGYESDNANLELDWDGDPGTVTVQNCTFAGSGTFNIWIENSGDTLRMYNTIVAGGRELGVAFEERDASHYQGDYNVFHNETDRAFVVGYEDEFSAQPLDVWRSYSGQDANSVSASSLDALFVAPAAFDFHPAPGSPAIDAGSSVDAPENDFEGTDRPQGAEVDIGAFEG